MCVMIGGAETGQWGGSVWSAQREREHHRHTHAISPPRRASLHAQVEYILIRHSAAKLPQFIQIIVLPFV